VTATREAVALADPTEPAFTLLRELRRGRARRQRSDIAYWIYLAALLVLFFGFSQISAAYRGLQHPPLPGPHTPQVLAAAPGALAALALLALLLLLRDGLWRGPVTLPQATVDWLLDTPVDRGRLLRPRFRMSAVITVVAGAAVGVAPAATLASLGLGGGNAGSALRLTGAAMSSGALLFAFGTGTAVLVERYPAGRAWLRRLSPAAVGAAAAFAGLAAWAAAARPAATPGALRVLDDIALWSGPWGWAAQPVIAAARGSAPLWPLAVSMLGALAVAALVAGYYSAAGVPGAVLRTRAQTLGAMSAAVLSFDTRGIAVAYSRAAGARRARFRLRPPRRRELVLLWRDLLALARAPSRLVGAVGLALVGIGLLIAAGSEARPSAVLVACGLSLGYLAAAWLCESARLDAEDTRRSANLPFRFDTLVWWHAAVPCLVLLAVAGVPVIALSAATGDPRLLALLVVTVPVLVAGAMVNVFRPEFPPDLFGGVDTPVGNTAAYRILFWFAQGPLLAVLPMTLLLSATFGRPQAAVLERAVVIGAGLAAALGSYAARRARQRRSS
jgi:Family of unknown function (DUF6297)